MTRPTEQPVSCARCGARCERSGTREVDGEPVCLSCLYGDARPVAVYPIGVVANDLQHRGDGFGTRSASGGDVSEIRLYPRMAPLMKGLADETRLVIVWQLHRARGVKTDFARGIDGMRVGPFASRTPDRLTPIAITEVELLGIEGTVLSVRGLDAIDGTPVLDIKMSLRHHRSR